MTSDITYNNAIVTKLRRQQFLERSKQIDLVLKAYTLDEPLNFSHINDVIRSALMPKAANHNWEMSSTLGSIAKRVQHCYVQLEYFHPPWLQYLKIKGIQGYLIGLRNEQVTKVMLTTISSSPLLPRPVQLYVTEFIKVDPEVITSMTAKKLNSMTSQELFNECLQFMAKQANAITVPRKRRNKSVRNNENTNKRARVCIGHGAQSVKDHTMVTIIIDEYLRITFNIKMFTKSYKQLFSYIESTKEFTELCAEGDLVDEYNNSFKQLCNDIPNKLVSCKYVSLKLSPAAHSQYRISSELKSTCILRDNCDRTRLHSETILSGLYTFEDVMTEIHLYGQQNTIGQCKTIVEVSVMIKGRIQTHALAVTLGPPTCLILKKWFEDNAMVKCREPVLFKNTTVHISLTTIVDITAMCEDCRQKSILKGLQHLTENTNRCHMVYVHRANQHFCIPQ